MILAVPEDVCKELDAALAKQDLFNVGIVVIPDLLPDICPTSTVQHVSVRGLRILL